MTGSQIITKAESYLSQNSSRFTKAYGVPASTSWCCIFVWYVFKACSCSKLFYGGSKCAYVPSAESWLRAHCKRISPTKAKPGDIIIFTWVGNRRDHIGFVEKKAVGGFIQTIEGNTLSPGRVAKRKRPVSTVYAIYRPNYTVEKKTYLKTYPDRKLPVKCMNRGAKGEPVKQIQRYLNWWQNAGLVVDGIFGPKTEKAVKNFQKVQKLKQNGVISSAEIELMKKLKK